MWIKSVNNTRNSSNMNQTSINAAARDILRDLATMSVGAVTGIYIYNLIKSRHHRVETPTTLIDSITCYEGSRPSSVLTFGWDEDEKFSWARRIALDDQGCRSRESLIEAEVYDRKLLVVETDCMEECNTPEITTIDLDPFGMGTSLSFRRKSGKEEHWDLKLYGGQLDSILSQEDEMDVTWDLEGNITSITGRGGEYRQEMTYYSNVGNRVFPDLNYLCDDNSINFLSSFILGSRSTNLISSMVIRRPDYHYHLLASYLCDRFDQPLQVRHEIKEIKDGEAKEYTRRYDIKYL